MLFVNVGWMKSYAGQQDNDPTIGNHGYLKANKWGHEAWNFKAYRGLVYGYVPGRPSKINLELLGGTNRNESLEGVTVVFIARDPRIGQTRIVGWYLNATVFRAPSQTTIDRASDTPVKYSIYTREENAKLLPAIARSFEIPTEKKPGNLGQHTRWYGGTEKFKQSVQQYIESGGVLPRVPKKSGGGRNPNPEQRRAVEVAAIKHAEKYYASAAGGRWIVNTRETEALGWDLDVKRANEYLKVEVKGLQGTRLCVELTPNEYEQMMSKAHRADYVVYVVTNALDKKPTSHVFYYNAALSVKGHQRWETAEGVTLAIEPRTGARLTA